MAAKILVVDQDPDIRDMLAKSLRQEGYDVAVAVDGREAIDQFKTLATDLVITRIPIPKTDDENMLRAVKAHAPLTEVIILTGNGTLINTISTLENDGTFHYLAKPFEDIQAFLTTVHNALERQQLRRQNQLLRDKVHASNRLCEEKSSAAEAARLDLQKTLERNASVMNAIPSGIMELDTQGMVKFANTACYQLFGLPPEELSGRLVYELMPNKAQRKDVRDYIENLVARTPQPTPKVVTGRSTRGEVLDLQVNWTYQCSSDGVLTGFIAVLTDITAQKRANEEHLQLEKRLVKAQKKQAISTLAGGIAHRFNNALAAVTGNLELLGQVTEGDPKINTYIERIMDQTEEMAQQTQKLLAYAEGGKYRAKHLDLGAFVKESLPIIRFGLEEECDIQYLLEQTAIGIKVDPTQLELVLSALVQNAAEATDADGSIWISTANVQAPPDTLPKLTPGPYACLSIEDNGHGMDAETLDRLFEPYFSTKFEGRGLGMAAVQGIIQNHEGGISVTSTVGRGTKVAVYLPQVDAPEPETRGLPSAEILEGYKLLIIEDELSLLSACEAMLTDLGCHVWSAPTAKSAIEQLRAHQDEIDLVLMDLILPDMGAMALFKALRQIRSDLRVVLCSGYSIDGPAKEILAAGALTFLQKPYSTKALIASLTDASASDFNSV